MSLPNLTIVHILDSHQFDHATGKIYRMYQGPDDKQGPKEYELPLTDAYLVRPFDPTIEWPDFFAEDAQYFYFPVPPLPGETVTVCKTKRTSRQLFPFQSIRVRHGDEMIHLNFSRKLVIDVGDVEGEGTVAAYWREARVSAIADSVDAAMLRIGIHIVNRLVSSSEPIGYEVRSDILITRLLHEKGINASVHFTEITPEAPPPDATDITTLLQDSSTSHTLQDLYRHEKDPKFN